MTRRGKWVSPQAQEYLEGIAFGNDCWVDRLEVSRRLGNEDVVEIEISAIKEANNGR